LNLCFTERNAAQNGRAGAGEGNLSVTVEVNRAKTRENKGGEMIRKLMFAVVVVLALPLGASQFASATDCDTWNSQVDGSHHVVGPVDVVGGKGYGSGNHDTAHQSSTGAYGDPLRRSGQGGYVQGRVAVVNFNVNFFGPLDETDLNPTHTYDTVFGACVSVNGTAVNTKEQCVPTSKVIPPNSTYPYNCAGYPS
jgi:hypothetical protein